MNTANLIVALALCCPLSADVPLGKDVTVEGVTLTAMPFPLLPFGGIQLLQRAPAGLQIFGLIVSVCDATADVQKYIVTARVSTVSGETLTMNGTADVVHDAVGCPSAVLSHIGSDLVNRIISIDITTVMRGAERQYR